MNKNKHLIILLGASGSGKTFLEKKLYNEKSSQFDRIISSTTREMRTNEKNGVDYHFFEDKESFFEQELAEFDFIDGSYYGTPLSELNKGEKDLLLTMEPNGARKIIDYIKNKNLKLKIKIIFFDIEEKTRIENMKKRGDSDEKIAKRIKNDDIDDRFRNNKLKADLRITELDYQVESILKDIYV